MASNSVRWAIARSTGTTTWTRKEGDEWKIDCLNHGATTTAASRSKAWVTGSHPQDFCPKCKAIAAGRVRTLSLAARHSPRRVMGRLYAAGYPSLYAGRTVRNWKVRSGPDLKVATLTTGSLGKFHTRVPKGRYYAKAPGLIVPTAGQVTAAVSPIRRLT